MEGLVTEMVTESEVKKSRERGVRGRQKKGGRAEEIHHGGKMCTHTLSCDVHVYSVMTE